MLHAEPGANVRVFVVWEPVLQTDWQRPAAAITSQIPDPRAIHWWDRERHLSQMLGGPTALTGSQIGFRMKDVVWDAALVYPPGLLWGAPATCIVAPVFRIGTLTAR